METKISDQNIRSLSIKLWGFRSQEKTTRTILIIFGARKTRDHACSRESKNHSNRMIVQKISEVKKSKKKTLRFGRIPGYTLFLSQR